MDNTQFGALLTVIGAGLGGIVAAVRWGLDRIANSFDAMGAKFDARAAKHEGEERSLIRIEGTVNECRADSASTLAAAREARDIVLERLPQRRTGQRPATAAARAGSPPRLAAALIHRSCSGGARLPAQSGGGKLPA
jgi:hypothetical protein